MGEKKVNMFKNVGYVFFYKICFQKYTYPLRIPEVCIDVSVLVNEMFCDAKYGRADNNNLIASVTWQRNCYQREKNKHLHYLINKFHRNELSLLDA